MTEEVELNLLDLKYVREASPEQVIALISFLEDRVMSDEEMDAIWELMGSD